MSNAPNAGVFIVYGRLGSAPRAKGIGAVLVDRDTAAVGSANLDNRSFRLNFEVMVVTVDEGFAGEVETMLEADFAESLEFTPEDRRSVRRLQQLGMRVARLVSPIL